MLLERKPNVNCLDKDGCTALSIACKEGFQDIANALMNHGAYVNLQDRSGDTNLIHAAKAGHKGIVEALLKKYADVNIQGHDGKTCLYWAVEKRHLGVVKAILNYHPDTELATKDGDTPLLKATRNRSSDIVQLLIEHKSKVSVTDKKGDNALHISMRSRSKGIVEILLRNPMNSQLLYKPNRAGETPYNIDMSHQKTILGQIFGARRLNTNEDSESMMGYDLYSSALADILSEPSLSMPIAVGLYAKWGSGKSFLLKKLRADLKKFGEQWYPEPTFQLSWFTLFVIIKMGLLIGFIISLSIWWKTKMPTSWVIGFSVALGIMLIILLLFLFLWYSSRKYLWTAPYSIAVNFSRKFKTLKIVFKVLFCHPAGDRYNEDKVQAQPIRFYFSGQGKVTSAGTGENSIIEIVTSIYEALESYYGFLPTRFYRVFKPKAKNATSSWKFRCLCCIPNIIIFLIFEGLLIAGLVVLSTFGTGFDSSRPGNKYTPVGAVLLTILLILGIALLGNSYTFISILKSFFIPQKYRIKRSLNNLDGIKTEGYLQALKYHVDFIVNMAKCLDAFTGHQSRLVIIVDGLDTCEQDKVLQILDAVNSLFTDPGSPFIILLALDPHIIVKAISINIHRVFNESNVSGHDYLRNNVHLPFYLQNAALRKVKIAQNTAAGHRQKPSYDDSHTSSGNFSTTSGMHSNVGLGGRRMSTDSTCSVKRHTSRSTTRGIRISDSLASSVASNIHKVGEAQDLTKVLLTDDYFSDVNPRSMRRLMNVVYVTGRLLKAFQIEFNWYHLATWINITEQWPFRTSWLLHYYDLQEENLEDIVSLKTIYEKVKLYIPTNRESEPLLELDRDARKFEVFLSFHKNTLLVYHLKIFLPFTINLDPFLRKVIKEEYQLEELNTPVSSHQWPMRDVGASLRNRMYSRTPMVMKSITGSSNATMLYPQNVTTPYMFNAPPYPETAVFHEPIRVQPTAITQMLSKEIPDVKLSTMQVEEICEMLSNITVISKEKKESYISQIRGNNISGFVLQSCDIEELKSVMDMNFGDWEIFKSLVKLLREKEIHKEDEIHPEDSLTKNVRFTTNTPKGRSSSPPVTKGGKDTGTKGDIPDSHRKSRPKPVEKQITMEDQMIVGALQTLNEEAFEDILNQSIVNSPEDNDKESWQFEDDTQSSYSSESGTPFMNRIPYDKNETPVIYLSTLPPRSPALKATKDFYPGSLNDVSHFPRRHRRFTETDDVSIDLEIFHPPDTTREGRRDTLVSKDDSSHSQSTASRPTSLTLEDDSKSILKRTPSRFDRKGHSGLPSSADTIELSVSPWDEQPASKLIKSQPSTPSKKKTLHDKIVHLNALAKASSLDKVAQFRKALSSLPGSIVSLHDESARHTRQDVKRRSSRALASSDEDSDTELLGTPLMPSKPMYGSKKSKKTKVKSRPKGGDTPTERSPKAADEGASPSHVVTKQSQKGSTDSDSDTTTVIAVPLESSKDSSEAPRHRFHVTTSSISSKPNSPPLERQDAFIDPLDGMEQGSKTSIQSEVTVIYHIDPEQSSKRSKTVTSQNSETQV